MACNSHHDWFVDDEDKPAFCAQCGKVDVEEELA